MAWKREITPEILDKVFSGTLAEHLGMALTHVGEDTLEITMPVDERTQQPFGLLHGGASAALAETLGSFAAYLCSEGEEQVVGLELNASHLRAVPKGVTVRGVCRPLRIGRSHQVWEIRVYDAEDRLCCAARMTSVLKSR
ncbi:MAG: hotdog fold thioesterase [Burkholderiales bacterium]|jgi:1,4-dihydroxy-2-naphthoyl-CoA hydrolase|nr:hotdog fold thioesterase [Burkholderiales bacterium]